MGFGSHRANGLGRVKTKKVLKFYRNMSQHVTYVRNTREWRAKSEYENVYVFENDFAALKQEEIVLKRMKQTLF
jgi:hypothetical protein